MHNDRVKILFAVDKNSNRIGLDCIAFNCINKVVAEFYKFSKDDSPLMEEIVAIEEALDLTLHGGWEKVNFFNDSKIGINCINDLQGHIPW